MGMPSAPHGDKHQHDHHRNGDETAAAAVISPAAAIVVVSAAAGRAAKVAVEGCHVLGMFSMSVNRIALGKRISFYRLKFSMTQEKLADLTNCSREYIAYLENGVKTPSLPVLVDLANALHISVDALLVDSLDYSLSSSDSDLHRLLLDCNETEQEIIIRTAKELKATLVSLGI